MTAALGFGVAPYGISSFGFGSPATATPPTGTILTGSQGRVYSSRAIGTDIDNRGQYVVGDDGRVLGMPDGRQMVLLAYTTVYGSAADGTLGQRLGNLRKIGDDAQATVEALAREPVAALISRGIVRFDGVDVRRIGLTAISVLVRLQDLTTNTPFAVAL